MTDIRTTVDRYTTHSWPIYHRHMTDSKSRCVVEISNDTWPIVYLTIDRLSTDYRPTIDRLSTDCRPLYRPLCRPISQSTLPTVNKILDIYQMLKKRNWLIYENIFKKEKDFTSTCSFQIESRIANPRRMLWNMQGVMESQNSHQLA